MYKNLGSLAVRDALYLMLQKGDLRLLHSRIDACRLSTLSLQLLQLSFEGSVLCFELGIAALFCLGQCCCLWVLLEVQHSGCGFIELTLVQPLLQAMTSQLMLTPAEMLNLQS